MARKGRPRKYEIKLSEDERNDLLLMIRSGEHKARDLCRAHILLLTDEGELTNTEIAKQLRITTETVRKIQKRYHDLDVETALRDQPRSGRPRVLSGKDEALIVSIACSEAPEERNRWTLRMIADRFVVLSDHESISHEQVRQVLKKQDQALEGEELGALRGHP